MRGRTWFMLVVAGTGVLLACNAIVGVEDVKLKQLSGQLIDSGPAPVVGDDDDDAGALPFDDAEHPTLALGYNHACARMLDSTVRCWGDNGAGQLGDGVPFGPDRPSVLSPRSVPGVSDAIAIASGLSHSCIVRKGGTVSCWGVNLFGQLGDGTTTRRSSPVVAIGVKTAVAISCGNSNSCALLEDKTVMCWGYNGSGNLGDGTKTTQMKPVAVKNVTNVKAVAAAADHTCALLEDGTVRCWGGNATGQLGIGSNDAGTNVPASKVAVADIEQIAAAAKFTCARDNTGRVYCWGANEHGQLGNGSATPDPNPSPLLVNGLTDAKYLWTGFDHGCAVRETGKIVCWGFAGQGQIGTGPVDGDASSPTPSAVKGITASRRVWTGGDRSCTILADNKGFCWGANTLGQLGNGSTERAYTPTPIRDFP